MPLLIHESIGAQLLQARLSGADVFYLSPISLTAPMRGGVPVMFPQFADAGPLAKHGLVRTAPWQLTKNEETATSHTSGFSLTIGSEDHASWPHAARLELEVNATPNLLEFALRVTNTGNDRFGWTGGLHPYFALQDLLTSRLRGLAGLTAQDRFDANMVSQPAGDLQWTEAPFERLFDGCPALELDGGAHTLRLSASGFDQWMVWNPGRLGANALKDLPPGDWRRFVCIEPVCVTRPIELLPGATFEGQLRIELSLPN